MSLVNESVRFIPSIVKTIALFFGNKGIQPASIKHWDDWSNILTASPVSIPFLVYFPFFSFSGSFFLSASFPFLSHILHVYTINQTLFMLKLGAITLNTKTNLQARISRRWEFFSFVLYCAINELTDDLNFPIRPHSAPHCQPLGFVHIHEINNVTCSCTKVQRYCTAVQGIPAELHHLHGRLGSTYSSLQVLST